MFVHFIRLNDPRIKAQKVWRPKKFSCVLSLSSLFLHVLFSLNFLILVLNPLLFMLSKGSLTRKEMFSEGQFLLFVLSIKYGNFLQEIYQYLCIFRCLHIPWGKYEWTTGGSAGAADSAVLANLLSRPYGEGSEISTPGIHGWSHSENHQCWFSWQSSLPDRLPGDPCWCSCYNLSTE